jgi:hypothetical protein
MFVKRILYAFLFLIFVVSCDDEIDNSLTNAEIDLGIKTVLNIGCDSVTINISQQNGFSKDSEIKVLLPAEGRRISELVGWYMQNASKYSNFQNLNIDLNYYYIQTLHSFNVAVGKTSTELNTLLKIQIHDFQYTNGLNVVTGKDKNGKPDSSAIVSSFKNARNDSIFNIYNSLVYMKLKVSVLNSDTSSNLYWSVLLDKYNLIADKARQILLDDIAIGGGGLTDDKKVILRKFMPIPDDSINVSNYVTQAALDNIYIKIGEVEKTIRNKPELWLKKENGGIIQRVFSMHP